MTSLPIDLIRRGMINVWINPSANDQASRLYLIKQDRMSGHAIDSLLYRLNKLEKETIDNPFLLEEIFVEKGYILLLTNDMIGFGKTIIALENLPSYPKDKVLFLKGIRDFRIKNFSNALLSFQKIVEISENNLYKGKAFNNLGIIFHKADPTKAENHYKNAIQCFKSINNKNLEIQVKENLVTLYKSLNQFDTAIVLLEEIMDFNREIKAMEQLAQNHHKLGVLLEQKGEFKSSIRQFLHAISIRENMDDQIATSRTYLKLARLYILMGELSLAIEMAHKCLIIREKQGTKKEIAQSLQTLAIVYHQLGDFQNSKSCLKRAMNLYIETANEEWFSESIFLLANLVIKEGKIEEAKQLAKIHDQIAENANQIQLKQRNQLLKAIILKNLDSPKSKFEALEILEPLTKEPLYDFELMLQAMTEIAELYLLELKVVGMENTLHKIEKLLSTMLEQYSMKNSYTVYVHFLILKAKLKFTQLNGEEALSLLHEADVICQEKGLLQLQQTIENEINAIQTYLLDVWETLHHSNAEIINRVQKTAVMDYLEKVTHLLRVNNQQET